MNPHSATSDQYTFQNPVTRFESIAPPKQDQPEPGLDRDLAPHADARGNLLPRTAGSRAARPDHRRDSGIGAAVAIAFAREGGADVAIGYLPEEEPDADTVIRLIEESGRKGA
jgi:DNA-binding transcriptional LysR family regulator